MAYMTNADLWNKIRSSFPSFASHTSEATKETFTEAGFEKLKNWSSDTLNEFFQLSMRVYLQAVNISEAKDPLFDNGFGEYYTNPQGGYVQRMATTSIKPVSPVYKSLTDGNSIDPFIVRKPVTEERFFKQNFDYQSFITIPDEYQFKQIFISEYGMSEFMGGIMAGLQNGYTIQLYENKLEAINAGINSTGNPLQDTQKVNITAITDVNIITPEGGKEFIEAVKNIVSTFKVTPQINAYNALSWSSVQDISRLKLLIRPNFKNALDVNLYPNTFNLESLKLPVDVVEVPHFGGLIPTSDGNTQIYPVYDKNGAVIGFNETDGQTDVTIQEKDVVYKDPNKNVIAVLADKGWLFHSEQNPYTVEPIRNPRGLYTNYWASSPNNMVCVDALYNVIVFRINETP